MTKIVVFIFLGLLINAHAHPLQFDVDLLKYENEQRSDGYDFTYETSDGTKRDETGVLNANGVLEVVGSFSFIGDDGVTYTVNYIADENGFQPRGAHILHGTSATLTDKLLSRDILRSLTGGVGTDTQKH